MIQFGVGAYPADDHGAIRKIVQHSPVGITAIDRNPQVTVIAKMRTHVVYTGGPINTQPPGLARLTVFLPRFLGCIAPWLIRGGGVTEHHRDHPCLSVLSNCRRHLDHPLSPHEVHLERGTHGVTGILDSGDLLPCFPQEAVIKGRYQWLLPIEFDHLFPDMRENTLSIYPFPAIHPVVSCPVHELSPTRSQQVRHSVPAHAHKLAQDMPAESTHVLVVPTTINIYGREAV